MGIFNYIDTFFFISLGITFILILLLVFHFKQRISELEDKSETMFQIINDIVKELTSVKSSCCSNSFPCMNPFDKINIDMNQMEYTVPKKAEKIIVSDVEDDDEDEDYDDEDEDDDEDEEEIEDDEDYENTPAPFLNILEETNVKIISVEIEEPENHEPEIEEKENIETVNIQVEKLESDEVVLQKEQAIDTSKEIYRRMTIQALKALVITKGLATDPSKMKKPDLLKLLESNEE